MRPGTLMAFKERGFKTMFNLASIPSTFIPTIDGLDKQMDEEIVASVRIWATKWGAVWRSRIIVRLAHYLTTPAHNSLILGPWLSLLNYRVFSITCRLYASA